LSNLDEVHEGLYERDHSLGGDAPDGVVDELGVGAVQDGGQDALVAAVEALEVGWEVAVGGRVRRWWWR
jgi:hypothetical protein